MASAVASAVAGEAVQGVLFETADTPPADATPARARARPAWRSSRLPAYAGLALVLVACALLVVDKRSASSSSVPAANGVTAELQDAAALINKDPVAALVIYEQVLRSDPSQPVALSSGGWLYAEAGDEAKGLTMLAQAEKADPSYAPAHLYRALVLMEQGKQLSVAVKELKWYVAQVPAPPDMAGARQELAHAEALLAAK